MHMRVGQRFTLQADTHTFSITREQVLGKFAQLMLQFATHSSMATHAAVPGHSLSQIATQVRFVGQPSGAVLQPGPPHPVTQRALEPQKNWPGLHRQVCMVHDWPIPQTAQAAPPPPQAPRAVPGWQAAPWQQPLGQDWALQTHAPATQA